MSASVVLTALPRDAHSALEKAGEEKGPKKGTVFFPCFVRFVRFLIFAMMTVVSMVGLAVWVVVVPFGFCRGVVWKRSMDVYVWSWLVMFSFVVEW